MLRHVVTVAAAFTAAALPSRQPIRGSVGKLNSTGCSDAPPCGTQMAVADGQGVYSNGPADQCSGNSCGGQGSFGLDWQCVELAVRYFNQRFGISTGWGVAYAAQMCSQYPAGVSVTGTPQHGDLAVFSWAPYGHVAVIAGVYPDGSIDVWEQNSSPTGTNTYPAGEAACYLTAGTPSSGCPATNGYYCGDDGLGMDANTLYNCQGGSVVGSTPCGGACEVFPAGQNDECVGGSCSGQIAGAFCGNDGIGGDASALYECDGQGGVTSCTHCVNGCVIEPSGTNDYCA